ncbi:hypothetical protein FJY94_02490 [Candidatus Kaiserbacteria bacterium]|nr:hypothetical protein [Candidatus Kaiserbacteria bacterium]
MALMEESRLVVPVACGHELRNPGYCILNVPSTQALTTTLIAGLQLLSRNTRLQNVFYDELEHERDEHTRALCGEGLYYDPSDDRWSFVYDDDPSDHIARWLGRHRGIDRFFEANCALSVLTRQLGSEIASVIDRCVEAGGGAPIYLREQIDDADCKIRTQLYTPTEGSGRAAPEPNTAALSILFWSGPGRTVFFGIDGASEAAGAERNHTKAIAMPGVQLAEIAPGYGATAHRVQPDGRRRRAVVKAHLNLKKRT